MIREEVANSRVVVTLDTERESFLKRLRKERLGILGVLAAVWIVGEILFPRLLSPSDLSLILSQNASFGIVAVGMTFVIITGGFDLSVGSTYALTGITYAKISNGHDVIIAALVAVCVGLIAGIINAIAIVILRVSPFITTLGTLSIYIGIATMYSNAEPIMGQGRTFQTLGTGAFLGVPITIWCLAAAFVMGGLILSLSSFGRSVYAVGGNREASRLSGVPVRWVQAGVYVVVGVLAGFAGVMAVSQLGVGEANIGGNLALTSIAMVVLGGTMLSGGEGSMWRTAVGFLILSTISFLFNSLSINQSWVEIAQGGIIIGAISVEELLHNNPLKGFGRAGK